MSEIQIFDLSFVCDLLSVGGGAGGVLSVWERGRGGVDFTNYNMDFNGMPALLHRV